MSISRRDGNGISFLAVLILSLAGCHCSGEIPKKMSVPENDGMLGRLIDSSVALVELNEEGDTHLYCSGSWVSSNEILTASHCVLAHEDGEEDKTTIHYVIPSEVGDNISGTPNGMHLGTVKRVDKDHDLALIVVEGAPRHSIDRLATGLPPVLSKLFFTTSPKGLYFTATIGVVNAYREDLGERTEKIGPWIQAGSEGGVFFGSSGGPVWNSSGELLGIINLAPRLPNVMFCARIDTIRRFLADKSSE